MIRKLLIALAWLYWKINLPFVAALSETVLGYGEGAFLVVGRRVAKGMDRFMHSVPDAVFLQFVGTLALFPLYTPPSQPRSNLARAWVNFWYGLKSFFSHGEFLIRRKKGRTEMIATMLERLNAMAPQEESFLIKTIVTTTIFKWAMAMAYFDEQEIWTALDYKPFIERTFNPPTGPNLASPPRSESGELLMRNRKTAKEVASRPSNHLTYLVIGSGAGGAVAARTIQERNPDARIIMLDSGPLVTNDKFSDKAIPTVSSIYMNAAVTLSADQQFIFQQGRCIGGSTTVNNSVAFKPEGFWWTDLTSTWKSMGIELDYDDLNAQYDVIAKRLHVQKVDERVIIQGARTTRAGWQSMVMEGAMPQYEMALAPDDSIVRAPTNSLDCIGCGRCNYGCQYEAKLSMLATMIPDFVRAGGLLVPDAQVECLNLVADGSGKSRVASVSVNSPQGAVTIEADRVILAAGAYASSKLLWRSGFTGMVNGVRTVGKRFSVNAGSPIVGVFSEPQGLWAGQQIGYALEVPELKMIIETVSGPPGVIAMTLPNWGAEFQSKLRQANYMAAAVPVFSTDAYGQIRRGFLGDSGYVLDFSLSERDWMRLEQGFKLTARAMFRMGAKEVFINRFRGNSMQREDQIDEYFAGLGPSDFVVVQSAHMQGGNVISPSPYRGVVDEKLRVHGMENLWICDASVIPSPITVNIALTVMALSRYAALRMPLA